MRNLKELGLPVALFVASAAITLSHEAQNAAADESNSPSPTPIAEEVPRDNSDSTMPWVLGTTGLAVLAGGVWAVSRMRRESL